MKDLINFCFKGSKKEFIAAGNFDATWADNENKFNITFDKASLKLAIDFYLDNCLLNFGKFLTNHWYSHEF